jgi:hypothetical protein
MTVVSHDDRGNESGERFIQRVVVGARAEGRFRTEIALFGRGILFRH